MAQTADIDGRNNIVVQITGDGNTVVPGHAHLTLTRYLTRRRIDADIIDDIDFLSPYTRSIRLIGRERETTELRGWLESDGPVSVRVITGGAGAGKTRLALELIEEAMGKGWDAGFVEGDELARFRTQQNVSTWGWRKPTLAVVDYVAAHADRLAGWLKELADNAEATADKPFRLLLLERHADPASGWWQTAFGRGGWGAKAVQKLLDPPEPVPLHPLGDAERRRVIDTTLSKRGTEARAPSKGENPAFDRELEKTDWAGDPLFLMMAGVLAAERDMGRLLALGRTDLAFELADRELDRLARIAEANALDPDVFALMAGHVTLAGGMPRAALQEAVEQEKTALGRPSAGDPGKVAKVLGEALPGEASEAAPIRPDIIGEAATLRAFERYDDRGDGAVRRAFDRAGRSVAAAVIRTAQDFAGASFEAPLHWLDGLVQREEIGVDQLMLIADTLPQTSLALLERSAALTARVAEILRNEVDGGDLERLPLLAIGLNNLAVRLSAVGRRQDALAPAEQAVALRRKLAARNPDAYEPALAMSLNNLAIRLSEVGRRQDALAPAEQAAALHEKLAARNPDAYEPALASSLNNLAIGLSEVGRRQDALAPAEQAAALYEKLAARNPDAYEPALAGSLASLAHCLEASDDLDGALDRNREAIEIYRRFFLAYPPAFAHWMLPMCQQYLEHCEKLGREPDAELLAPIAEVFEQMQAEAGESE